MIIHRTTHYREDKERGNPCSFFGRLWEVLTLNRDVNYTTLYVTVLFSACLFAAYPVVILGTEERLENRGDR